MDAIPVEKISSVIEEVIRQLKTSRTNLKAEGVADLGLPGELNPEETIDFTCAVIVPGGTNANVRTQTQENVGEQVTTSIEEGYNVTRTEEPVTSTSTEAQEPFDAITTVGERVSSDTSNQTTNQTQRSGTSGGNIEEVETTYE